MTPSSARAREFGIQTIQTWTWRDMCERWAWFEALGWDSLWLPDHFVPSANNDQPMFEAWTLLSALATQTERVRIGVLVSSAICFNPSGFSDSKGSSMNSKPIGSIALASCEVAPYSRTRALNKLLFPAFTGPASTTRGAGPMSAHRNGWRS